MMQSEILDIKAIFRLPMLIIEMGKASIDYLLGRESIRSDMK